MFIVVCSGRFLASLEMTVKRKERKKRLAAAKLPPNTSFSHTQRVMSTEGRHRLKMFVIVLMISLGSFATSCMSSNHSNKSEQSKSVDYSTYDSFEEMVNATDSKYFDLVRISPAGTKEKPMYHGFFYYGSTYDELLQFDPTGRYMLALRVFIEGRRVQPHDKGEVGYFDLRKNNKWTKIGETTAWNWQQGCRLQWVPGFEEIVWNDRSEDGKSLISKVYNFKTKKTHTLPMTVYTISPDGQTALTVNFERIKHGGCSYVGIDDPYENVWAPAGIGIWIMNMKTGKTEMISSVRDMAKRLYPDGLPSDTIDRTLYFFRGGFNPSGNRLIAFVKDAGKRTRTEGYTMNLDGSDVKYFYRFPSHHFWLNDFEVIDNGSHEKPDGSGVTRGYFRFEDDGSGSAKEFYFEAPNGHSTPHKSNGDWLLTDCYNIKGYVFLYLYHIPTKKLVPLSKIACMLGGTLSTRSNRLRVDLHPRFTPDGKYVCIDATHEGLGRQIYMMDVSRIIANPPK